MALKGLVTRGMENMSGASARAADGASDTGGATEGQARLTMTQAPGPRTVAPATSVDASSEFEGKLRCSETLRIDGRVVGEIECQKAVIIGQAGRVHAGITADDVQVAGIVEGDITASRKVTLERTAVVVGDLTTPGIVIEEGAKLKGRIVIGSDAEAEDLVAQAKGKAKTAPEPQAKNAEKTEKTEAPAAAKSGKSASGSAKSRPNGSKSEPLAATA